MALELKKIPLKDAHVVHGVEFPVAYELVGGSSDLGETLAFLQDKGKTGWFDEQIQLHGALILRNLGGKTVQEHSELLKAIEESSGDHLYTPVATTVARTQLTDVITTANEKSPALYIAQHNEYSRFLHFPTKLVFVCNKYTGEGGDTPIVHGGELFEKLYEKDPEMVKKIAERGLHMQQTWSGDFSLRANWSHPNMFGQEIEEGDSLEVMKKKAEKQAAKNVGGDFRWEGNDLVADERISPFRKFKRVDGEEFPAHFSSLPAYYWVDKSGEPTKTTPMDLGDGEKIPEQFLETLLKTTIDLSYIHKWEEGDIAFIDNLQVSHGRNPWKGERQILVSMWDSPKKEVYKDWKP